ncbi:uncharacterized protein LOC119795853 [Cyprinodon tularosa]|uniref:uncharacterized protein LOC119795853 n=1 Tax=Cyprinodon tularosa TaxID=77115 RepID=UPI0018E1E5CB|nr:uncharacterized protein LOC119795853 [Cyprinodon tularosa]
MTEELKNTRAALKHKEEELQSFKDRVAADITPSIKTGDRMMSLNSPVSKSRLTEMYETLRCDWLDIKVNLKSNGKKPDAVRKLIKESFLKAKTQMEEKKAMISKVFDLDKSKHGTEHPKIKEFMLLTVQNLQMALYYQKHGPTLQEVKEPKEMMDGLGSRCYWLGCLMALSDPPIQPDWDHHPPSMDKWDILPRNVVASEKSSSNKTTSCVV